MKNRCGCKPVLEPFEFELGDIKLTIPKKFPELFPVEPNIDKDKLICEYEEIINKLECGYKPDLESLLQELSWIYIKEKIFENNVIYTPPTIYIGFDYEEDPHKLDLSKLNKRYQETIEMSEVISNDIYGGHLWIVSPYALNKVATDEGFNYEVVMIPVLHENGLYYYRSSSRIDICNLTYYIK